MAAPNRDFFGAEEDEFDQMVRQALNEPASAPAPAAVANPHDALAAAFASATTAFVGPEAVPAAIEAANTIDRAATPAVAVDPVFPVVPVAAMLPVAACNVLPAPVAAMGPTTSNPASANDTQWAPKQKSMADAADPWVCPGLNNDCYHFFKGEQAYWDHVLRKHNYSRKMVEKPENAAAKAIFKPARPLSWYDARGIDTTYWGDDRKQIAARQRREDGVSTEDADYAKKVYGSTMTKADRRM